MGNLCPSGNKFDKSTRKIIVQPDSCSFFTHIFINHSSPADSVWSNVYQAESTFAWKLLAVSHNMMYIPLLYASQSMICISFQQQKYSILSHYTFWLGSLDISFLTGSCPGLSNFCIETWVFWNFHLIKCILYVSAGWGKLCLGSSSTTAWGYLPLLK